MIIVSSCLCGVDCRYNGGNNNSQWVMDYIKDKDYILLCPEVLGGLDTPREPSEIVDGRVIDKTGKDLTDNFITGAEKAYDEALKAAEKNGQKIELAILKANSPSCGIGKIYDGTFSKNLIDGNGKFAELLSLNKIRVITENMEEQL